MSPSGAVTLITGVARPTYGKRAKVHIAGTEPGRARCGRYLGSGPRQGITADTWQGTMAEVTCQQCFTMTTPRRRPTTAR